MSGPVVSVLLPFRDAGATIERALAGLLASDAVSLEVVAVDDGSTDAGASLVARIAERDPRVRLLRGEAKGIVAALDRAHAHARGSVLVRMDADDECDPRRIPLQLEALERDRSLAALGTRVEAFTDEGTVGEGLARYVAWQNGILTPDDHARELFVESPICHPSLALRREAFEAIGGYRAGPFPEDYDLFLRLHREGHRMAKLDAVLVRWRHRSGRLTFADPRYSFDAFRALKVEHLAERLARETRPLVGWGAGRDGRRMARALLAAGLALDRFVDIDPRKIGRTAYGRPIVGPEGLPGPASAFVLVCVGSRGARAEIREHLDGRGFREVVDYVCLA
ncbi:MAG: glycosyltransferase family 2 protein [Polyangiales bacterium]